MTTTSSAGVRKAAVLNWTQAAAPGWRRLAGLPLLLRNVLVAQRAGIEEVVVVGGEDPARLLGRDSRVKLAWRWVRLDVAENSNEVAALRRLAAEWKEDFLLFFADSVFDAPAAAALRAAPLDAKLARAAAAPGSSDGVATASLFVCSAELLRQATQYPPETLAASGLLGLASAAGNGSGLDKIEVPGSVWPRTSDRKALRGIQQELSRLSLKPSDGFYARFNKMWLAQPLIRFFLRTPATPNFITSLGLLLGLSAGLVFAHGGYWWAVAGSLLWFLSAIMDHIDGMVARLKFLESEFGTWFESFVDYAATFSAYVGMTIGLYRESGVVHHLTVGGFFIFGAVMSFIVQSRQRRQMSSDNPADYPNRMHRRLDENSQNLFLWFSRKAYFVARRAVLPYYMLIFCLLDLRVLFLGWSALGANVLWIMTLYFNRLLRPTVPPATAEAD
ncbi:MAG: CDP-alcohol phosphatidyltransferase family protein [Candidatus Acidiferrales bacterium]